MKWLNVELSLLLLVSLVAGVGLFSLGSGASVDDSDSAVNDLSGFQTYPLPISVKTTNLYNGLGEKVLDFGTTIFVDSLRGQTCYYHKKTGNYYRFKVTGYDEWGSKGKAIFTKEYPASPNWFGGKGGACQQINLDIKTIVGKLVISGVAVKGSPNAYNSKFDVVFSPKLDFSGAPVTYPTLGFTFVSQNIALAQKLADEASKNGLPSVSVKKEGFSNFPLKLLTGVATNYIFVNKDGSRRVILLNEKLPIDPTIGAVDIGRAEILVRYYNSQPGVVAWRGTTQITSIDYLFDFNPK